MLTFAHASVTINREKKHMASSVEITTEPYITYGCKQEVEALGSAKESQNLCVPRAFTIQAGTTPNAVALSDDKSSLSYRELDQRANHLASKLRSLGVGPEIIVGLYLNRSIAMIVGALATLKAGGAYLPLDPAYPAERLAFQIMDAHLSILITGAPWSNKLPLRTKHVVTLDPEGRPDCAEASEPVVPDVQPGDLAYLIYTSGSTGEPKGVEVTHASLSNLVRWHQRAFAITANDRASHLSPVAFDASVWELWPYLTVGASIHLTDTLAMNEPDAVRDWFVTQGITIGFLPSPLAERAIMLEWPLSTRLRTLLTGADTLHHFPRPGLPFALVNNYGPTECTVVATSGAVPPQNQSSQLPSIGSPIDNTELYILNESLQPVRQGETGQIYIGGAGLARRYRNRPDLTTERFVPNPFRPGTRLYCTGDMGSRLSDGKISFLGRVDDQIKLHGFRIEPAEVAKALNEHPDVETSLVVAREIQPGDKCLVAYFIAAEATQTAQRELRSFLAERLPDYMIPAIFVKLQAFPLNRNSKIDRSALPPPSAENMLRDIKFIPPRTKIESRVATILAALLGIEQVGVADNFFLMGGHSLLGTQLIANIISEFGIELSLRNLFEAPTVQLLSRQIEDLLLHAHSKASVPSIEELPVRTV